MSDKRSPKTRKATAVLDSNGRPVGPGGGVRSDIAASWARSEQAGVSPDHLDVQYDADVDDQSRFRWAATDVMARLADDLVGTRVGLVLSDQTGHVVARSEVDRSTTGLLDQISLAPGFQYAEDLVGTNAIGTALTRGAPTFVQGDEHYVQALTTMSCAAVPVTDPASGRLIGVVDLTCAAPDAHPLMLPLVRRAGADIEQGLLQDSSVDERTLQERFLRARRTSRGPLAAINGRTMLVNGAAGRILGAQDHDRLWEWVQNAPPEPSSFTLSDGRGASVSREPVNDGRRLVGALLRLRPEADGAEPAQPSSTLGWSSLTETELAVAELVAEGLTNREAAARLYLSPHTIDYHLRQIFRKLAVTSRVDLTRVVLQQHGA